MKGAFDVACRARAMTRRGITPRLTSALPPDRKAERQSPPPDEEAPHSSALFFAARFQQRTLERSINAPPASMAAFCVILVPERLLFTTTTSELFSHARGAAAETYITFERRQLEASIEYRQPRHAASGERFRCVCKVRLRHVSASRQRNIRSKGRQVLQVGSPRHAAHVHIPGRKATEKGDSDATDVTARAAARNINKPRQRTSQTTAILFRHCSRHVRAARYMRQATSQRDAAASVATSAPAVLMDD